MDNQLMNILREAEKRAIKVSTCKSPHTYMKAIGTRELEKIIHEEANKHGCEYGENGFCDSFECVKECTYVKVEGCTSRCKRFYQCEFCVYDRSGEVGGSDGKNQSIHIPKA